ncbi:cupin domain-containing protein [Bacillus mangrovi]|uniref:Cupin domain-containing protein n=1 Tax=Metabacillus mangrovi TaxID=1491830 RepID=A0A7X2V6Q5_9BACI|nr:cupin domain-containing protein [Metabacillus mangrovi]MTH55409.1 cupin domain-containing protein [Metabacillus mangrovi]
MYEHTASPQFAFDTRASTLFRKDSRNYINIMGARQLNTVRTSLLDIFLSRGNYVEPHYHQNAAELVYCISGAAEVSILNPNTKQLLQYRIGPQATVNVPQGWWHYEKALTDQTHLLAIFNSLNPEVVLGSDILHFTPATVMAETYCMDQDEWKQATRTVKPGTYIGPYTDCERDEAERF